MAGVANADHRRHEAMDDLILAEIIRTTAPTRDVDQAIRFVARRTDCDAKAYQALSRRGRRLVDLLIAADSDWKALRHVA